MALIAGMMVSCDPITESDPGMSANLTEADLQARVVHLLHQSHTDGTGIGSRRGHPSHRNRGFHHWHSSPHELDRPGYEPRRLDRLLFTRRDNQ